MNTSANRKLKIAYAELSAKTILKNLNVPASVLPSTFETNDWKPEPPIVLVDPKPKRFRRTRQQMREYRELLERHKRERMAKVK